MLAVLIYGATITNLAEISAFIANANSDEMILVYIGLTLILFTFSFSKLQRFHFQSWLLDVYRGAPMIITAYMASNI